MTHERQVSPGAVVHCERLVVRGGPITMARLAGEVDLGNATDVGERLEQLVLHDPRPTVIDLSGLEYLDLAGLRMLERVSGRLRVADVRSCVVLGPGTSPRHLVMLLARPLAFPWEESLAAAIRAVTPG